MNRWITPRGVAITASTPEVAHLVHCFEEEVLNYGRGAAVIFDAVSQDPHCGLAHAYAAAAHMFRLSREGQDQARQAIGRAQTANAVSARETLLIDAIGHWTNGEANQARRKLRHHIASEPLDLFAAKLLHYFQLGCGDANGMLETSAAVLPHHPEDARAHAMHAFALEQSGDVRAAEQSARRALEIGPDPWAHHALAHVMDSGGRYHEGRAWMHGHAASWANCSSFLFTHNWWHAALFHIAVGDHDGALQLYHERVWSMRKDYAQDQINAISLLARLELTGVDVGDRWRDIADYVRPNAFGTLDGLLDLHHAYALGRAGDHAALATLIRRIADKAMEASVPWHAVSLRAARGLAAFALGQHEDATRELEGVMDKLHLLGGSTVQRNLFALIYNAARRCGRIDRRCMLAA